MLPNPSFMFCMAVGFMAQSNASPDPIFNSVIQFGALGLCAYMILANNRHRDRAESEYREDRLRMMAISEKSITALHQSTTAMLSVAEAIKGCPENQARRNK